MSVDVSAILARRILALPPAVREALAAVPGPGWRVNPRGHAIVQPSPDPHELLDGYGWWPANPAAAVAAVLRIPLWDAHRRIYEACTRDEGDDGDDHAAAVEVIEGHVQGLPSAMSGR